MDKKATFIRDFALLGDFLRQFPEKSRQNKSELVSLNELFFDKFSDSLNAEQLFNPWFTPEWLDRALLGISGMLEEKVLQQWLASYEGLPVPESEEKTVGLILAGNIPLVGFHDILSVLAAGHKVKAKVSSKDSRLLALLVEIIGEIDAPTGKRISISEARLEGIDAIIATGSNNSSRYFEYYFRDKPHIIRKNRNAIAVLSGEESEKDLMALGEDIFTYFGLGCRNVSKLYIPENYDLTILLGVLDNYVELAQHNKYSNNVDYYRSIYLMNRVDFLDNGVVLLKEDNNLASPVGVVFYERYTKIEQVQQIIRDRVEEIQCVISLHPDVPGRLKPGTSQEPLPWDYADGIDTLSFLKQLK